MDDPSSPLVNRALQPYYPGSVFKVIVAAAALEAGVVDPFLVTVCHGSVDVGGGEPIQCSHHDEPEIITVRDAMAYSCNPVFVSIAQRTGGGRIVELARRLGIGSSWEEVPEGKPGTITVPDSLRGLAHLAIGQEYVRATPLEMTAAVAAVANGGFYRGPRLVREVVRQDGRVLKQYPVARAERVLRKHTVSALQDWLSATVEYGTGVLADVSEGGSAGKTGTPENSQSSWKEERCDAWFVGWAPRNEPRYVIGVFVEDGASGPSRAAPVFRDIAERALAIKDTP